MEVSSVSNSTSRRWEQEFPNEVLHKILAEVYNPHLTAPTFTASPLSSDYTYDLRSAIFGRERQSLQLTCHRFCDLIYDLENSLTNIHISEMIQGSLVKVSFPCPQGLNRFKQWLPVLIFKASTINSQPAILASGARRLGVQQTWAIAHHKRILKARSTAGYLLEGLRWQWRIIQNREDREIGSLLRPVLASLPMTVILAIRTISLMSTVVNLQWRGADVLTRCSQALRQNIGLSVYWRAIECFILSNGPTARLPDFDHDQPSELGRILEQVAKQASNTTDISDWLAHGPARSFAELHTIIDERIDQYAVEECGEQQGTGNTAGKLLLSRVSENGENILQAPDPSRSFKWTLDQFERVAGQKTALELVREARKAIGMPMQAQ